MREIIRITIALTISCVIAGTVMGFVFTITDKAKKHNEHLNVQATMLGLLGYDKANPAPAELEFHTIYRYIIADEEERSLGYLVPVQEAGQKRYDLVIIGLRGEFIEQLKLELTPVNAAEKKERDVALEAVLEGSKTFIFAESSIIAKA